MRKGLFIATLAFVVMSLNVWADNHGKQEQGKQEKAKSDVAIEYGCPVCDTGFMSEEEWVRHAKKEIPDAEPVVARISKESGVGRPKVELGCPVCDTGFMTPKEWDRYKSESKLKFVTPKVRVKSKVKTVRGEDNRYACPICDTGFVTEAEWKEYIDQEEMQKKNK
jgi:uncharacterized C2H2 Zn-finger protein